MKMQDNNYCPRIVDDIELTVLFENQEYTTYSMGSKLCDRYIQINEKNKNAIEKATSYMDGLTTLKEIQQKMLLDHHIKVNVMELCEWLGKAGLLDNPPDDVKLEKQEMDYLSITIKKWDLNRFCNLFSFLGGKHGKKIFGLSMILILVGIIMFLMHWREFIQLKNYELNGSLLFGVCCMVFAFVISLGFHELAHAVVGYYYGLKPKELVFALYVGTPMFYVKIPGIYTLEPKKRILVWSAGVYMNLMIASLCIIIMHIIGGNARNLILIGVTTNLSLVLANLSPLLPLDGYFILSTILKKPNLRKGSFQQFKNWFLRRDNKFEGLYLVYFLVSVSFYSAIVLCEVKKIIQVIHYGIAHNYGVMEYVYEFRLIGIIIGIIILKKVIDLVAGFYRDRKKGKVYVTS